MSTTIMREINIAKLLVNTPKIVNFSQKPLIVVAKNEVSPIYINIRLMLSDVSLRLSLVESFVKVIANKFDCVAGIESGGSYFAAAVADKLKLPLVLVRKQSKKYGDVSRLVGQIPKKNAKVAILDDVLATGTTANSVVNYFKGINCEVSLFILYSYGFHNRVANRLNIPIIALSEYKTVGKLSVEAGLFSNKDLKFIDTFVTRLGEI